VIGTGSDSGAGAALPVKKTRQVESVMMWSEVKGPLEGRTWNYRPAKPRQVTPCPVFPSRNQRVAGDGDVREAGQ